MRITGHALIDVGEATLHAMASRPPQTELNDDDLLHVADWLAQHYTQPGLLQNLIRGLAFFNAGYYQANDSIRQPFVDLVLYSWRAAEDELLSETCSFCGASAAYRANREHVPLLNGRDVFNFSPAGRAGLPICGRCSLAIQALPIGCRKTGQQLMAIHSDDPGVTYMLTRENVANLMRLLSLPDLAAFPKLKFEQTRFVEMLVESLARSERRLERRLENGMRRTSTLTAYCFSNYGAGPSIHIYRLNVAVIRWVEQVIRSEYSDIQDAWWRAVLHGWNKRDSDMSHWEQSNQLYEDLLSLPEQAARFFRTHVLPQGSWAFARAYLEAIMNMTPQEIEKIRETGTRFAEYVQKRGGSFAVEFARIQHFPSWRRMLLNAADDCVRRYGFVLISFDDFVELFLAMDNAAYNDWRLVRDLITLLLIEARLIDEDQPLFEDDEELTG